MAASVARKKVRWPSYQIKRLDNGANFGSLRSRQCRQKARKARRRNVLSPTGKFSPMAQRWILFLRASYFRSRYNKVPSFDKTSSHEFPATWENVNTEGVASGDVCGKKASFTELTGSARGYFVSRGKRSKIFTYVGNLALCRACRIIVLFNAMTGIFDGRISLAEEVFVLHLAELMEM